MSKESDACRPRILITRAESVTDERWDDYADRITEAGGEPVAADLSESLSGQVWPTHQGLVLTGGVDVDPSSYGETRSTRVLEINTDRDRFETGLLNEARDMNFPVLAICRGHQLLNVARGGTLLQHIEKREPHRARLERSRDSSNDLIVSGWHDVEIRPGTILAESIGAGTMHVNSRHHQAVTSERVAPSLLAAATTSDGIIEALVDPSVPWTVSVQWHPEMPEVAKSFHGLFKSFVDACTVVATRSE